MIDEILENRIVDYYTNCERHYRALWGLDKSMALHYGYWGNGAGNHLESLAHMNGEIARRAGVTEKSTVLDAGCGVGGTAIYLAKHIGCRAVGLNLVPRQLELARNNAIANDVSDRVEFRSGDFTDTPFADNSFDIAVFCESACHAPTKDEIAKEMARILRPGGVLLVADFFRTAPDYPPKDEELIRKYENSWSVPRFATVAELHESMSKFGFSEITFDNISDQIRKSSTRLHRLFYFGIVVKSIRRLFKKTSQTKLNNLWSTRYQAQALNRDLWNYQIMTAVNKRG